MSSTSAGPNLRASGLKGKTTEAIGAIRHLWGLTVPAGVSDAIVAALRWMNNPWKFIALMGFGITALFGAIVWDQRVTLVTVMVEPNETPRARIERERSISILTRVLRETGGAIALVSSWDLEENRRTNVAAVNRVGRALRVEPETLPIVRSPRLAAVILPALMAGDVPCIQIPPTAPAGEIDRIPPDLRLLATSDGLTSYCVGPVNDRGALIGSLTVMFEAPPTDTALVAAAMRRAAVELLRPRETR